MATTGYIGMGSWKINGNLLNIDNDEYTIYIYSFISSAGGFISLIRKFFGSAKSAIFNVATGFRVSGLGYL